MPVIQQIEQTKQYKVVNGTSYNARTNPIVVQILENARLSHRRLRLFYGDRQTGKDWNEQFDVFGYVGRSTGSVKIPLLIHNKRSMGGGSILDHSIVKITDSRGKVILWQHPLYH